MTGRRGGRGFDGGGPDERRVTGVTSRPRISEARHGDFGRDVVIARRIAPKQSPALSLRVGYRPARQTPALDETDDVVARMILPLPLREGVGGRGSCLVRTPPPNPLPQGEGESVSCQARSAACRSNAGSCADALSDMPLGRSVSLKCTAVAAAVMAPKTSAVEII